MFTIMRLDCLHLLKNKPIMTYLLLYPPLLIWVTGFVFNSIFGDDVLTSYDYYGVTMMIYLSMATVVILPDMLFGSRVKNANNRIIYTPIALTKVYLSKLLVATGFSYGILAAYMLLFNAIRFVNFGGSQILPLLLLDLAFVIFAITFGGAFCVILRNEDLSTNLLNLVINVFAIVSGLFFPMKIFGKKIAAIADMSPIAKVSDVFFAIIYDHNFQESITTFAILVAGSCVFLIIIHMLYRPEKFEG